VEAGARLGARVTVGAGAVVGRGVSVGDGTSIGANASLSHCDIGARCQIHDGARIGTRGFGFDMSPEGHLDVPQLGRVIVGDEVEIGANSTIDRGSGPDTVIGDGCKIDNLVQIGHNVRMGQGCVVVAQAGVAGSATLQDFVVLAAQSGVGGHLTIAPGTQLAARSGIMRDTEPGAKLAGNPAIPAKEYFRQMAVLAKLAKDRNRQD
ncbi:MAG: UDP-3-O-(3-hydroxymyristoyl)glucosamine N-acyltransferase, partial [Alphaproteobacteria bacterium]|nr:UDP-3-O-(3-hydroxymyristoyl)glucosamine N-acyltransferase [Alphaproteobacteria bacterium]